MKSYRSFKHDEQITTWLYWYAFSFLLLNIFTYDDKFSWVILFVSYFIAQVLGIGVGLHRCAGHGVGQGKFITKVFYILGLLTHAGPLKGSALNHERHHLYADTPKDYKPEERTSFMSLLGKEKVKQVLNRFDKMDSFLDNYYYVWFLPCACLMAWVGEGEILFGFLLATFTHNVLGARILHSNFGYRNFETLDNSRNIWWAWFLFFGENWHNNHHGQAGNNYRHKWWEIDIGYLICRILNLKN
jgi:stearoyl-CoA desaturase (delta-9 desaturase)